MPVVGGGAGEAAGRATGVAGPGLDIRATLVFVDWHVTRVAATAATPPRSRSLLMRNEPRAFLVP